MAIIYSMINEKKKKYPLIDLIYYRQKNQKKQLLKEKKIKKKNMTKHLINLEGYFKNFNTPEGAA